MYYEYVSYRMNEFNITDREINCANQAPRHLVLITSAVNSKLRIATYDFVGHCSRQRCVSN